MKLSEILSPDCIRLDADATSKKRVLELASQLLARFDESLSPRGVFDCLIAREKLGWRPRLELAAGLKWCAEWYRRHLDGEDALALTLEQIARYEQMEAGGMGGNAPKSTGGGTPGE